tara:strand:+ start:1616 stop:2650 length:1035 start_codon:yes stop_codon:yes gene_type:complete
MPNIKNLKKLKKTSIDGFYDSLIIDFDLHLNELDEERLIFYNCIFKNNIFISSYNLDDSFKTKLEFSNCKFEKKIKCDNILFEEMFVIKNTKKESFINLEFYNVEFDDTVIFKGLIINKFVLNEVEFNEEAFFYSVEFRNKLDFIDTYFYKSVYFDDSNIKVENRRTARIIKDSFEQQNNIIEANKFYALEMKEREKELKFSKEPFEWLVFKIHGLSSNHSQDWLLSLFWIVYFTFAIVLLNYNTNINVVIPVLSGFILGIVTASHSDNMRRTTLLFILAIFNYGLYSEITKDFCLHEFTNKLNPFSIMNGWDDLNFGNFIYKIIIAYLIYQLIISIRQNTRRK